MKSPICIRTLKNISMVILLGSTRLMAQDQNPLDEACIPSGDQTTIQMALKQPGDKAILCAHSEFKIYEPILFTAPDQEIYTIGFPRDNSRGKLVIANVHLAEVITGRNLSRIKIRNIKIDGSRTLYEGIKPDAPTALIGIGGNAADQVVEWTEITDPRGWTSLHIFEGNKKCSGARIENNTIGPAGKSDGTWADGISLSCRNSIVRNNYIFDTTDGAIVIFGSPGSLIENNTIEAKTRVGLGAINMVDYAPWDGDYTGVVVQNNSIKSTGATIKVAIAMGPRTWGCDQRINYGATVRNNQLFGKFMGFGYAISGVKDWVVADNVSYAKHSGKQPPHGGCNGPKMSRPKAFLIDKKSSSGQFQCEFSKAKLNWVIGILPSGPDL